MHGCFTHYGSLVCIVYTSSRYRQGDSLRQRGVLFLVAPFLSLSIWVQPSALSSSFQFQFQPCEYEAQGTKWRRGRRQEAGERRGHQFLPACAFEQPP